VVSGRVAGGRGGSRQEGLRWRMVDERDEGVGSVVIVNEGTNLRPKWRPYGTVEISTSEDPPVTWTRYECALASESSERWFHPRSPPTDLPQSDVAVNIMSVHFDPQRSTPHAWNTSPPTPSARWAYWT
jgi:hypothetical protein